MNHLAKEISMFTKLEECATHVPHDSALAGNLESLTWQNLKSAVDKCIEDLRQVANKRNLVFINNELLNQVPLLISTSTVPGEFILISSYHSLDRARELMNEFDAENLVGVKNGRIKILATREATKKSDYSESFIGVLTSGTTGSPKCALYDWKRLAHSVIINPKFRGRKWMMSYHITNFAGIQVFLQCFLNGGCLIVPRTWPSNWFDDVALIDSQRVDYLNCTATYSRKLILSMVDPCIHSVKSITLGGEVIEQALIDDLKKKFPETKVIHIYASTEMGSRIEVRDELEGFPLSYVNDKDLRISEGELQLRPSGRSMLSYLGKKSNSENDWISTGDLVTVKNNRVYFLGRKDLVINVGGFKVNPTLVEAAIRQIPGVAEVIVSGVKNPIAGNLVKATIVPMKNFDNEAIKTSVIEVCRTKLPYYSVPRLFEFVHEIKLTSSSKLKRVS